MIQQFEFEQLLEAFGWKYPADTKAGIWLSLQDINIVYDEALQIGQKYNSRPTGDQFIKTMRAIEKKTTFDFTNAVDVDNIYMVLKLDIFENEYYQPAIDVSITHGFLHPSLIGGTDDMEAWLCLLGNKTGLIYEWGWLYASSKGYKHNLPAPEKTTYHNIWKFYGIEPIGE